MKKVKVISNVPERLPVTSTVLYTFLMYHFQAGDLWWGIFITIESLYWILMLAVVFHAQEKVNIFENKTATEEGEMVTFAERLKRKLSAKK